MYVLNLNFDRVAIASWRHYEAYECDKSFIELVNSQHELDNTTFYCCMNENPNYRHRFVCRSMDEILLRFPNTFYIPYCCC